MLKRIMVQDAKLSFKDTVNYNRFFQDLADQEKDFKVNIKYRPC